MSGLNRDITIRLLADTSRFSAGMAKTSAESDKLATTLESSHAGTKLLTAGLAAAGVAASAFFGAAVNMAAEFDASMSTVQANTGASADEMDKLRQAAIDAGAETVYSASESADAINELGKAGMSTTDILAGGLSGALNLAASDGMEVSEAAELMSSAMAQFNLTGKDATTIADALAAGAGKAQGSAHDLGYALQQSGMVANSFGISMQETVGTLTSFANAGMIGSDAGTSLKTMLIALAKPSTKAANTMEELGINAYDAQGNFVGLANLAGQLQTKMGDLTQAERNQALATIFGNDAIRAANVLYNEGADGIQQWTDAVSDSGYASEQAAAKNNNLKGDLENLSGSMESLMINIGEAGQGPMRSLVQTLDMLVDGFGQLPQPVQQGVILMVAAAGSATALHAALKPLNSSTSGWASSLGLLIDPLQRVAVAAPQLKDGFSMLGSTAAASFKSLGSGTPVIGASAAAMSGLKSIGSGVVSLLGGPWGIALTAATVALGVFVQSTQASRKQVEGLTDALKNGSDASEYFEKTLNDPSGSSNTSTWLARLATGYDNLWQAVDKTGISHKKFIAAIKGDKDAYDSIQKALNDYAASASHFDTTAGTVNSGLAEQQANYQNAIAAAKNAADADKLGAQASMEKTAALLTGNDALATHVDATTEAADAGTILEESFGATTDAVNEQSAALSEAVDALKTYYGFALSESDATIAMYNAFDKASQSVQENGKTLDLNTKQGRDNQSALNDLAESVIKAAQAQAENGATLDEVNATLDLGRKRYEEIAQAMGMTPEAAEAAAKASGLTGESLQQVAQQASTVPQKVEDAKTSLTDLGLTVQHLPNGEIKITGDNTEALKSIEAVNGVKIDDKTGTLTLDKHAYDTALALANGAKIDEKTGKLIGDNSDFWKKIAEANGWKIDEKTGYITADDGQALAVIQNLNNMQIADKYFQIHGTYVDESGGQYSSSGYRPKGATGNIPTGATGGLYTGREFTPGYASGGIVNGLVSGPGTGTSDSIWLTNARIANGEFVQSAAATEYYGPGLMSLLNERKIPRDMLLASPANTANTTPARTPASNVQVTINVTGTPDPTVTAMKTFEIFRQRIGGTV
ncbi:phage tail tape measure protein [Bifidobacterium goeldii]|uniref:Phage tail tape measure protein n=1 Tax=Bifidobacterium goeldii TaxID=2306975 RepID=A0A430FM36_9BIFI|nr:phage tail tape measure protein [Bifidobacterium goeldii]RSX53936.1 phage tail tape measure protein [Bifidobacterium goeldii]